VCCISIVRSLYFNIIIINRTMLASVHCMDL
jgi:hypothetical protein